jgi:uncharacterized protein DUF3592
MSHDPVAGQMDPENLRSWRLTKAAVFALIGIGAIVWLVLDQRDAARQQDLVKTGTATQGKVVDMESRRGGQHLTLSYEFWVNGATLRIAKRRVGDFNGLGGGGPVTVWYDPSDPTRCVTHNELSHVRFGWTPYLYGGVIAVIMGLAAWQARQVLQPNREPTVE